MFLFRVLLFLMLMTPGFARSALAQVAQTPQYVSMLQLIANPDQFDGRLVCVTGFLRMEHDGDLLFLHQEDDEHGILENAIQVKGTQQMVTDTEKIDGKYIRITGVFSVTDRRRFPFFGGSISEVQNYKLWSDPKKPISRKILELPGVTH